MSFLCMPQQIGKVLAARISDEDKRKILSANAAGILARREGRQNAARRS
jgi:hypothetical protein